MNAQNLAGLELMPANIVNAASTVTETGVNLAGYVNPGGRNMKAVFTVNHISGTSPTLDMKIQESDSLGSGYTDIAGAAITQVTTTDSKQEVIFKTNKQYVRIERTGGGTSPVYYAACILIVEKRQS